jgi:4-amino-4-deoxy-L-arabinose transferase-like glycosyltransferase
MGSPWRETAVVAILTLVCLVPFADKAFHIDDTLFVYAAEQILNQPLDPYGFDVNWDGRTMPMSVVTKNPPLTSYYSAIVGSLFGLTETPLHLAFLLPAVAVALGTLALGRRFSPAPRVAVAVALATPVFLISATNVMSDVLMLAFWVWAIVFWDRGLRDRAFSRLAVAGVLIALAALTKYFGVALVPLLLIYTLLDSRRAWSRGWIARSAVALMIPILTLAAYQIFMALQYDRNLLIDAVDFAAKVKPSDQGQSFVSLVTALALAGSGCVSVALFGLIGLGRRARWIVAGVIGVWVVPLVLVAPFESGFDLWPVVAGSLLWQVTLWSAVGVLILTLPAIDWLRERSADSALLGLWVVGTFVFAGFVNWSINGRSILPMVPAVGLLVARGLGSANRSRRRNAALVAATIASATLALLPTWADYRQANISRDAVVLLRETIDRSGGPGGATVWFQGHWGFQYYAERAGMQAIDRFDPAVERGDWLVVPGGNVPVRGAGPGSARLVTSFELSVAPWISTLWFGAGGGFYADFYGPLAFGVGEVPDVPFALLRITNPALVRRERDEP